MAKPILKDVVSCIFDEKSAQTFESRSLSNLTTILSDTEFNYSQQQQKKLPENEQ